jgi:hypothetical protein
MRDRGASNTLAIHVLREKRTASAPDIIEHSRAAANGTIRLSGVASIKHRDLHWASRYVSTKVMRLGASRKLAR